MDSEILYQCGDTVDVFRGNKSSVVIAQQMFAPWLPRSESNPAGEAKDMREINSNRFNSLSVTLQN